MASPYNKSNKRKSFFAEQRDTYMNPNFINNMDLLLVRQNVKRIIKDINDCIITQEDYEYFRSNNVINACIQESYEQYLSNRCIKNALSSYRSIILPQRLVTPEVDINTEYTTSGIEFTKAATKETIWWTAYCTFMAIYNGANPMDVVVNLMRIPKNYIKQI